VVVVESTTHAAQGLRYCLHFHNIIINNFRNYITLPINYNILISETLNIQDKNNHKTLTS
jgi:hypothetical protein